MFVRRSVAVALALALSLNSSALGGTGTDEAPISFITDRLGGNPQDWIRTSDACGPDPITSQPICVGKYYNVETGAMVGVVTDAGGRVIGFDDLEARRAAALAALPPFERKADPALQRYVAEADAGVANRSTADIGIFVAADTSAAVDAVFSRHPEISRLGDQPYPVTDLEADLIEAELHQAKAAVYARAEAAVADRIEGLGAKVIYMSTAAPLLFAEVPTNLARVIAGFADVTEIGLEGTWHEAMNVAGPTIQANWTGGSGDQGNGIKVGVIEYRSVHNTGDMAGKVIGWYNATANNNTPCYDESWDHPTWVAGAVASQNATYKGVAPGAQILSGATCGFGTAQDDLVIEAADWALAQGADILNLSLVQDTASGAETARQYFDSVVAEQLDNVVAAAGNLGICGIPPAPGSEAVGSPGVGWNVLTVGGVDDKNSTSHLDDRLWYSPPTGACWVDPDGTNWNPWPDPDFNKPEVSAPAYFVRTANGLDSPGTSVAAPIVTGIVAQLLGRSAIAKANPNLAKALVMAGAIWAAPLPNGQYDTDHQGIGYVSAKWANNALISEGGSTGGYHHGTFSGLTTYTKTFGVTYGQFVQVAVVWNSQTLDGSDNLDTDLDLVVTFPDGTQKVSDSATNAWEYIDHESQAAGTVTMRVTVYRIDTAIQSYALAWIKSSAP